MSPICRRMNLIENILDVTYVNLNILSFFCAAATAAEIGKHKYTILNAMNFFIVRK